MKNPLTPAGIEQATYRFVAQHLNQCATTVLTFTIHVSNLITAEFLLRMKLTVHNKPSNCTPPESIHARTRLITDCGTLSKVLQMILHTQKCFTKVSIFNLN